MNVSGRAMRTIWVAPDGVTVRVIDQTQLPHVLAVAELRSLADAAHAIRQMLVRGAPLIGVTAAYGLALAMREDPTDAGLVAACATLAATRPTAVNLLGALDIVRGELASVTPSDRALLAYRLAAELADDDVEVNRSIARHGLALLRPIANKRPTVEVMTHCNAGWLATVDVGTALAPIYAAHDAGLAVHVWVSETRPRNQGASLTAWELGQHGVPHTVIVDNAAGHILQRGVVDLVLVGTDRTTAHGDVANKVGTYLKALAARDSGVPFFVAAPSSSIDWSLTSGGSIPIEERSPREVTHIAGRAEPAGFGGVVQLLPDGTNVSNFAFDVTPARLVTGLITERGVCAATARGLLELFPERATAG